jgi:hypothetical protein
MKVRERDYHNTKLKTRWALLARINADEATIICIVELRFQYKRSERTSL